MVVTALIVLHESMHQAGPHLIPTVDQLLDLLLCSQERRTLPAHPAPRSGTSRWTTPVQTAYGRLPARLRYPATAAGQEWRLWEVAAGQARKKVVDPQISKAY